MKLSKRERRRQQHMPSHPETETKGFAPKKNNKVRNISIISGLLLIIVIVLLVFAGLALNAWKMMRQSERMLKDIDRDKLNDLSNDEWED